MQIKHHKYIFVAMQQNNIFSTSSIHKLGWPWTTTFSYSNYDKNIAWPKISIVTPSYNQGQFIEETIRSILLQNYPNLEYIIIDGGSTDNTVEIIKKYEPWITYWVSEPDEGQTDAINKGFRRATGEIINWLNSDDLLEENSLWHIAQAFLDHPEAMFIYGRGTTFWPDGRTSIHQHKKHEHQVFDLGFTYMQQACFYKRVVLDTVGYLDDSYHFAMDVDFFRRIILNYDIHPINEQIARFRIHDTSKTSTLMDTWFTDRMRSLYKLIVSFDIRNPMIKLFQRLDIFPQTTSPYPVLQQKYTKAEIEYYVHNALVYLPVQSPKRFTLRSIFMIWNYYRRNHPQLFRQHSLHRPAVIAKIVLKSLLNWKE